ncbi:MAG: hypothetical protein WCF36_12575 [Candidatus Nanopelagicales bacterium]
MEGHAARPTLEHQQRAVAHLLDSVWDPIGVYDDEAGSWQPGEYESYAWQVLGHLRDGDTEAQLMSVLVDIKARMMQLPPGPEDARAAHALIEWYRDGSD